MTPPAVAPAHGRLFRTREAAQYLGCSVDKVRRLVSTGELVAVRSSAGRLEGIYEYDCDAYLAAHRGAPEPTPRPAGRSRIAHLLPPDTERSFA